MDREEWRGEVEERKGEKEQKGEGEGGEGSHVELN